MAGDRFHGRVRNSGRRCAVVGCRETGEFRAPNPYGRSAGLEGPGDWQWLCLDHVREFNAAYNFFAGMSRDEIEAAQMPAADWASESRTFRAMAGVDAPPRWADFNDPLDAISARFRSRMPHARADGRLLSAADRAALKTLELGDDADRKAIRAAYSRLVRQFHPDRNGGDRGFEKKLQRVVEAYQHLRKSPPFT